MKKIAMSLLVSSLMTSLSPAQQAAARGDASATTAAEAQVRDMHPEAQTSYLQAWAAQTMQA